MTPNIRVGWGKYLNLRGHASAVALRVYTVEEFEKLANLHIGWLLI